MSYIAFQKIFGQDPYLPLFCSPAPMKPDLVSFILLN